MPQTISLKKVEAKAFKASIHDGLWDVLIGCFVLQFAVAPLLSSSLGDFWSSAVFVPFLLLVYIAVRAVRKRVVAPRAGVVKYGAARRTMLIKLNALAFVVLLVAFLLGILSALYFDVVPSWIPSAVFGAIILVLLGTAAHFLDFPHLYIYGALAALSPLAGEWLWRNMSVPHHGFPVTFGATAAIIITVGLVKFARHLRDNPIPEGESSSEEVRDGHVTG